MLSPLPASTSAEKGRGLIRWEISRERTPAPAMLGEEGRKGSPVPSGSRKWIKGRELPASYSIAGEETRAQAPLALLPLLAHPHPKEPAAGNMV